MLARHEQPREDVVLYLAGGWLEWMVDWMDGWRVGCHELHVDAH